MHPTLSIVAAVNDEEVLRTNLAASPVLKSGQVPLIVEKGHASAGRAYNAGIAKSASDIVILAHQDVYLPEGWEAKLQAAVRRLEDEHADWGVLGVYGMRASGRAVGRVWSSGLGKEIGSAFNTPEPVVSLDELVLVIRRANGLTFDERLPGFHLYGTDIVQSALACGLGAYAIHAPVIHNSKPVRVLDRAYWNAYRFEQQKWKLNLPILTCIVPITRLGWPRFRYRLSRLKARLLGRQPAERTRGDPRALAGRLGYESPGAVGMATGYQEISVS